MYHIRMIVAEGLKYEVSPNKSNTQCCVTPVPGKSLTRDAGEVGDKDGRMGW